ncbi:hypothetical protein TTHERM_000188839 (macronuclear) [Tetrahymena thermophila SB210]|uniref:Uncharacterized protein n=1 Tax=Tetrahymena thermophila (strain SB210) TaxID=312017 RepID=W7X4H6_TETTS|nr:hypothetical protein TTHERM_000188839 [Tetrahymena thermophila SB210]EWS74235.1 hypothetical protein TTHERM_000188839 [Tetrahymena thermophila SB210]|eukprot:XP_012653208.1 hypothetical protein TTHERM_000188839 [Tetrahymena thermophila SB210]
MDLTRSYRESLNSSLQIRVTQNIFFNQFTYVQINLHLISLIDFQLKSFQILLRKSNLFKINSFQIRNKGKKQITYYKIYQSASHRKYNLYYKSLILNNYFVNQLK